MGASEFPGGPELRVHLGAPGAKPDSSGTRWNSLTRWKQLDSPESLLLIGMGLNRQGEEFESQRVLLSALLADPRDDQARFALLRPWLNQLDRADTPGYVADLSSRLTGSQAAVVEGWQAAARQDWLRLVELDPELARTRPNRPMVPGIRQTARGLAHQGHQRRSTSQGSPGKPSGSSTTPSPSSRTRSSTACGWRPPSWPTTPSTSSRPAAACCLCSTTK